VCTWAAVGCGEYGGSCEVRCVCPGAYCDGGGSLRLRVPVAGFEIIFAGCCAVIGFRKFATPSIGWVGLRRCLPWEGTELAGLGWNR